MPIQEELYIFLRFLLFVSMDAESYAVSAIDYLTYLNPLIVESHSQAANH